MIHVVSLLFALLPAKPQGPPPSAPREPASVAESSSKARTPSKEGWKDLDLVLQIVNEQILTTREFLRDYARLTRKRPVSSKAEAREAESQIRSERVKDALRVQAGQDLGIDPAQLDRQVRDIMRRTQERLKGSTGMAAYLKDRDRTLFEEQELTRDSIHALFWDNYVTGEGSIGANTRPSRDLYVRPGYLKYTYRQCTLHPELLSVIGGSAPTVVLQQLFLEPGAPGSEADSTLAEDLRRRILDGEDMGDLVDLYDARSNKQNRGVTEPYAEARLMEGDPAVGAFVRDAKPGDVSEVLPFQSKDKSYLRLVRLVERTTAVVPVLESAEVQGKLSERIREDLSEWRRSEAFRDLVRASYVWPAELIPR
jgi:hypothetical protein